MIALDMPGGGSEHYIHISSQQQKQKHPCLPASHPHHHHGHPSNSHPSSIHG